MSRPQTDAALHAVGRYVPDLILYGSESDPTAPRGARCERLQAAVLFADIAGFTALTERLAKLGPSGAEQVATLLNGYFERFIDFVREHGGDVLKLAGDSALVAWRAREGVTLEAATRRASQTALRLQRMLGQRAVLEDTPLATRMAVGAGDFIAMHVGGVYDRWELLVSGAALRQITVCAQAAPGDVMLSSEAASLLGGSFAGDRLPDGAVRLRAVEGEASAAWPEPPRAPRADAPTRLRAYVPAAVRARLDAGQSDWLAELRTVTALFIGLPGANELGEEDLASTHARVRAIQTALYRYEGSLNKLSVDEKGLSVVAAMGLPPFAHEDDALRAVQAARRIHDDLLGLGARCSIGVAHGRVFCGVVGSVRRCEYTIIGDVVNLAARLMQATDDVLCDAATRDAARGRFGFEALAPIRVKGKAEPVAVHVPIAPTVAPTARRPMVGRQSELGRILARLPGGSDAGKGALLIEGDAGVGKSRLVAEAAAKARERGVRVLEGRADPAERSTAYHVWRPIFAALLGVDPADMAGSAEKVRDALESDRHRELLPLLDEVLALGLPDNDLTSEMHGQVRADNTRDLLLDLLRTAAAREPLALFVEDTHWIDSASLGLVLSCARRLPSVPLVLTTRPLAAEPAEFELRQLLAQRGTERLRLAPLGSDDVATLVGRRLSATRLSERVVEVIQKRAQGNPFFSEELAHGLREAGVLVVRDGEASAAPGVDLDAVVLPESIEGVITSRIDRLSPDEQLALKVASVIGREFDLRLLRDVHPVPEARDALPEILAALEQREIVSIDASAPDVAYSFRHAIVVDAVYGLMLFAQRRQLHRAVAESYERAGAQPGALPAYGLLAHHWVRSGDEPRALEYLEKAGGQALRSGAYTEATSLLTDALEIYERSFPTRGRTPEQRVRAGRLHRLLGEARYGLGRLDEASEHLERSLESFGGGAPWSAGVPARILSGLLAQVTHRLAPSAFMGRNASDPAVLEAARAWALLVLIYFFRSEPEKLLAASLHGLNLAEMAGPSPELAAAYAGLALAAGLVGSDRLAEAYIKRARETAEVVGESTAIGVVHSLAAVHFLGRGDWGRAHGDFRRGIEIFDALGDRRRWTEATCAVSTAMHYEGRFEERLALGAAVSARGKDTRDRQSQAWGLLDQAESLLPLGRTEEAFALLDEVLTAFAPDLSGADAVWAHGMMAVACLRKGDVTRARSEAETTTSLMKTVPPTNAYTLEGYAGATDTFLHFWEEARDGEAVAYARAGALAGGAALKRFASAMPIGLPRYGTCAGLADWLRGRHGTARRTWQKGLEAAVRLSMPYEEGRAHWELGRHAALGSSERRTHLEQAHAAFARVGAAYDLERVERA